MNTFHKKSILDISQRFEYTYFQLILDDDVAVSRY